MTLNVPTFAGIALCVWFVVGIPLIVGKTRSFAMDTLVMTVWLWVLFPLFLLADGKLTWPIVIGLAIGSPVMAAAFALRFRLIRWSPTDRT